MTVRYVCISSMDMPTDINGGDPFLNQNIWISSLNLLPEIKSNALETE